MMVALKRREWQSAQAIQIHQEHKLRRILAMASTLPYYRGLFKTRHINPASVSRETLPRLPILTKAIIRQHFPEDYFRQIPQKKFSYWYTAGSTGTPFMIVTGSKEDVMSQTLFRYACGKAGLRTTDTLCYFLLEPENTFAKTSFQKLGIGRHYTLNLRNRIAYNIERVRTLKPQVLFSFPSYLALVANYVQECRIDLPFLRLILTGGEVLTSDTRHVIQAALAPVRDTYGSVEFSRLAYECEHERMHLIPDAAIVEVDNPDEHGVGHALITSLYHETMPLIRYDIGDRLKVSDAPCRCGVPFDTIEYIEGRCNDFLVLPSGRRISWRSIIRFRDIPGIVEYQIIQKTPDYFEAHIQKNHNFTNDSAEQIRESIRTGCLGEKVSIDIVFEETLTRGRTGKLRAVISEVVTQDSS